MERQYEFLIIGSGIAGLFYALKVAQRNPFEGIGNPEALKHDLQGFWSRRIDSEHRLVYSFKDNVLEIVACRYHY